MEGILYNTRMAANKTTSRNTPVRRSKTSLEQERSSSLITDERTNSGMALNRGAVMTGAAIVIILALLFAFRSFYIAEIVNGQPIWRLSVINQLEKQGGTQALDSLETKVLIEQEAKKKGVKVTDQEVDSEIKTIEQSLSKQGQTLDQALEMQGLTKPELRDRIRIQKLAEKMLGGQISVTDKEVNDFVEKNKASIPEGSNMDQIKASAKDQLSQQKLQEKFTTWLADLKKNAKITNVVHY